MACSLPVKDMGITFTSDPWSIMEFTYLNLPMLHEMFGLLKELTSSRTPKKVFVKEEAGSPTSKCINAISLVEMEKEKSIESNKVINKNIIKPSKLDAVEPLKSVDRKEEMKDKTDDESARNTKEELIGWETKAEVLVDTPRS
nr:hypothetical protein [Tanacetum cinerariifolium]